MATIRQKLLDIAQEEWTIRSEVAKEALTRSAKDIEFFFQSLARYGCVSWWVDSLIRYSQTHKFFDVYYYEIIDIIEEIECFWIPLVLWWEDIKNKLSWLCFEHVAYKIATEDLGLFQ